jgi:hypothetical protein
LIKADEYRKNLLEIACHPLVQEEKAGVTSKATGRVLPVNVAVVLHGVQVHNTPCMLIPKVHETQGSETEMFPAISIIGGWGINVIEPPHKCSPPLDGGSPKRNRGFVPKQDCMCNSKCITCSQLHHNFVHAQFTPPVLGASGDGHFTSIVLSVGDDAAFLENIRLRVNLEEKGTRLIPNIYGMVYIVMKNKPRHTI